MTALGRLIYIYMYLSVVVCVCVSIVVICLPPCVVSPCQEMLLCDVGFVRSGQNDEVDVQPHPLRHDRCA